MATPTQVAGQALTSSSTSTVASIAGTYAAAPKGGTLLIACVEMNANTVIIPSSCSAPSGWELLGYVIPGTGTSAAMWVFYRISRAGDTAGPWTFTNNQGANEGMSLHMDEWTNVDTNYPFDSSQFTSFHLAATTSGQTFTSASIIPTINGTVPIAFASANDYMTIGVGTSGSWVSDGASHGNGTSYNAMCAGHGPTTKGQGTAISETFSNSTIANFSFPYVMMFIALLTPTQPTGGYGASQGLGLGLGGLA